MAKRKKTTKNSAGDAVALSDREIQVLHGVVSGQTNGEIGHALGLSYETIKTYVARLRTKLGVPTKTALGVYAVRHNLVKA